MPLLMIINVLYNFLGIIKIIEGGKMNVREERTIYCNLSKM